MPWLIYTCADCEGDDPYQLVAPKDRPRTAACAVETCPACGSHLGFVCEGEVVVTQQGRVLRPH